MISKPTILCVAAFRSPHIVPVYDELAAQSDTLTVLRASLRSVPENRTKSGWTEFPTETEYILPWRDSQQRRQYWRSLISADYAVLPGCFHLRTLPLHHLVRRFVRKPTFLWSERFARFPDSRSSRLSGTPMRLKMLLGRALMFPCNSPRVSFWGIGAGAECDYKRMGMSRWDYRQFLFSVDGSESIPGPSDKRSIRLVFCGRITRLKGADLLVKAMADSRLAGANLSLTLIGDGDLQSSLENFCKDNLLHNVTFLGALQPKCCQQEMGKHDVLVLPSLYDGWGAVVNEAMEAGLAVVVSDAVGSRRPLVNKENGIVFQSGCIDSLVSSLQEIAEKSTKEITSMRTSSRKGIRKFRPIEVAKAIEEFCMACEKGESYTGRNGILAPFNNSLADVVQQ